jgi:hypothetical protein
VLEKQVRRMLADKIRGAHLELHQAWLSVRSLKTAEPVVNLFPDFDDNRERLQRNRAFLRRRRPRRARPADADYTFVNERLAKHYGIPNVRRAVPARHAAARVCRAACSAREPF